jgi:Flp pilus assembly protein TadG
MYTEQPLGAARNAVAARPRYGRGLLPGRRRWTGIAGDDSGAILIFTALLATVLIGFVGLAIDVGVWYRTERAMQNAADSAAVAAALNGTSTYAAEADAVAAQYGFVNGSNGVTVTALNGQTCPAPNSSNTNCYTVTIALNKAPQFFSAVLGVHAPSLSATAGAGTVSGSSQSAMADACIIALSTSGTGVTVSSASSISAPDCAVASNQTFHQGSCGSDITTVTAAYETGTPPFNSSSCSPMIQPPSGYSSVKYVKQLTADPLAGTTGVTTATSRLSTVEALTSPAAPSETTGPNLTLSASSSTGSAPSGCTLTHSGASWTLTCPSGGTYDFGSLTVESTATLALNTGGSAATTYDFSGGITVSSSASLTAGPGTFNIAQGITVASASSATFGAGTFDIGSSTSACTDGNKYSLCIESSTSLTLGGPSSFTFGGGIYAGSSATIKLGSGTTNTYAIGSTSPNNFAAVAASSAKLLFADTTSAFEVNGNIEAASSSCMALPDAPEHDVNGAIIANSASDTTLGSGIWTVADYIDDESASGGGGCSGWSGGTADTGVTLVLGAVATPSSGTCSGMAVCVLSASSNALVAPTAGSTAGLAVIGPTSSSNTAGALFESASSGSYSGAVYLPHGPITVSSASSLGGGSSACLELIGSQITITSASSLAAGTCSTLGQTAVGGSVTLVE